ITSIVISVEAELSIEAIETMVAAMNPATTRPTRPDGSKFKISVGYTASARGSFGNSSNAQVPGKTIKNSTGNFNKPANNAPQRAWSIFFADNMRCTIDWLVHQ